MDGLRIYFDFTLPTLLLYNFEREQYQMVMKLTPHPAETKEGHHDEFNGKITAEDKYGVVSSSTESSPVKQEFTNVFGNQTDTKEGEGECNFKTPKGDHSGCSSSFLWLVQNSFSTVRFSWVVTTTLYHLMLQSWYQKTA